MNALVIDAYDSFVYIVNQYLKMLDVHTTVVRNDQVDPDWIERMDPDMILLGPGPGHPKDSGYPEIITRFTGEIPIMGICLGHQAIGLAFGAKVRKAGHLMHGKTSSIIHDGRGCFTDIEGAFRATRYHSLIVSDIPASSNLEVTACSVDDGFIMGLRHRSAPIESVQFHPESVYTEHGLQIIGNFISEYVGSATQEIPHPMIWRENETIRANIC